MSSRPAFVEQQERHYEEILAKVQYLAKFKKYDHRTQTLQKGFLRQSKMPRSDFLEKLKLVRKLVEDLNRDPINLFMMSQFIKKKAYNSKLQIWVDELKAARREMFVADGEEPEYIPGKIRVEFHLLDLVSSNLDLRRWLQIFGEGEGLQGIAIGRATDGPGTVVGTAAPAGFAPATPPSRPSQPPEPQIPPTLLSDVNFDDLDDIDDPFVIHDEEPSPPRPLSPPCMPFTPVISACVKVPLAPPPPAVPDIPPDPLDPPWDDFGDLTAPLERVTKQAYNWETKEWNSEEVEVRLDTRKVFAEGHHWGCLRLSDASLDPGRHSCVAKYPVGHNNDDDGDEDLYVQVEMRVTCRAIAAEFNGLNPPKRIHFLDTWVIARDTAGPDDPSVLAVEPFITPAHYRRSPVDTAAATEAAAAFTHFSWRYTNHTFLVVNLCYRGAVYVRPQIHTANGEGFGPGNRGTDGIQEFVSAHVCNATCRALGLPDDLNHKSPRKPLNRLAAMASRLARFIGAVRPVPNDALPEDLAVLGIGTREFNAFVGQWLRLTGDNTIFSREAVELMDALGVDFPDDDIPSWAYTPTETIAFRELLCYYCMVRQ
jgi:hypothetical protein